MKNIRLLSTLVLCLFLTTFANTASSQEDNATPLAGERLAATSTFLKEAPQYSVDIKLDFELEEKDGTSDGFSMDATLEMFGTTDARFKVQTPDQNIELFVNETSTILYLIDDKQYIDGSLNLGDRATALTAIPSGPFRGSQMLLSDLLHATPAFGKTLEISTIAISDTAPIEGNDQIHLTGTELAGDFWIQQGDNPLLSKFSLDLIAVVAPRNPSIKRAELIYTFSNWNLAPDFNADHFVFTAPEGVTEFVPPQQEQEADPMIGMTAPALELPLLDGGTLNLADHKGKEVVILDFWASWCGPCRVGLPIVTRVAEKFKDAGVVMYAVNIAEDAKTVQAFVEQLSLTAPVALDQNRTAQRDYQADSIPKTVIVGKDGIIREVHVGVVPGLEEKLETLLTELTK